MHTIGSLAGIVECIASDAEGLLASRRQLGLLVGAGNVHREGLALRAHQLRVPTILIS